MRLSIKYNTKSSMWIVYINKIMFFNLKVTRKICKFLSKFLHSYFILLKILRQYGLKKAIKNIKNF